MNKGEIILRALNTYCYNDTNEAGDKLEIIDSSDFPRIVAEILEGFEKEDLQNFDAKRAREIIKENIDPFLEIILKEIKNQSEIGINTIKLERPVDEEIIQKLGDKGFQVIQHSSVHYKVKW